MVWLECIGVVSGWCCKEVILDRYPYNITYPYSTCISFFGSSIPNLLLCSFLKCFLFLYIHSCTYVPCHIHSCTVYSYTIVVYLSRHTDVATGQVGHSSPAAHCPMLGHPVWLPV